MTLSAPKSQKAEERPISFVLDAKGAAAEEHTLFIRPSDLSITFPSKVTVNQTLGGAWVDSFGEGLQPVTISGTTGWRAGLDGQDGLDRLISLRESTYHKWHSLRDDAIAAGDDPGGVRLRYVDTLNQYTRVIVPLVFEIRRSRSQPLLGTFRISFMAIEDSYVPAGLLRMLDGAGFDPSGFGLDSLTGSISEISSAIGRVRNWVNGTLLAPVRSFMQLSTRVLTTVRGVINQGAQIGSELLGVARDVAQTGTNLFRTLAAIAGTPMEAKMALMNLAGAFSNAFCVMRNALRPLPTYEDYSLLHGASNCSSTSGGLPPSQYAGTNVFFNVKPLPTTPVSLSSNATRSLKAMTTTDVVQAPLDVPDIVANLNDINVGVVLP